MGDALEALRRLQRQESDRAVPVARKPASRTPEPPAEAPAEPPEPAAEPGSGGPVSVALPVDVAGLAVRERQALEAAGLLVRLEDGREVTLGLDEPVVLSWPLGAVDELGLALPYLRGGEPVAPFVAADRWKWWRGGLSLDELRSLLVDAEENRT